MQVLTTVEAGRLFRDRGVEDLASLPAGAYDKILGTSSGGAQLFGTTGVKMMPFYYQFEVMVMVMMGGCDAAADDDNDDGDDDGDDDDDR